MNTVENDFKSSKLGYEILFIFIAGIIWDILTHIVVNNTKFVQGLAPYYKSLESIQRFPKISSYFNGAIYGGLACVVALFTMKLFMYALEKTNDEY
jgi:hypothetical protein